MSLVTSNQEKKSFAITVVIYTLLLLILFFMRFWPPSNVSELVSAGGGGGGVTVNFGDSDFGKGDDYKSQALDVKAETKQTPTQSVPDEEILSQDDSKEETVVIAKHEKPKKQTVQVKVKPEKVVIEKPKVAKTTNSVLDNMLKGNSKGGDGDDGKNGNKGSRNGSISNDGYGNGGSGGGKGGGHGPGNGNGNGPGDGGGSGGGSGGGIGSGIGYSLGNRKALSKPMPDSRCSDDVGKVVVQVTVDKSGRTISAIAGIKGTTITAKCLKDQAKQAAMNTKWQPSGDGQEQQVGQIVYSFSLN
jgi:hypothetical protein